MDYVRLSIFSKYMCLDLTQTWQDWNCFHIGIEWKNMRNVKLYRDHCNYRCFHETESYSDAYSNQKISGHGISKLIFRERERETNLQMHYQIRVVLSVDPILQKRFTGFLDLHQLIWHPRFQIILAYLSFDVIVHTPQPWIQSCYP